MSHTAYPLVLLDISVQPPRVASTGIYSEERPTSMPGYAYAETVGKRA